MIRFGVARSAASRRASSRGHRPASCRIMSSATALGCAACNLLQRLRQNRPDVAQPAALPRRFSRRSPTTTDCGSQSRLRAASLSHSRKRSYRRRAANARVRHSRAQSSPATTASMRHVRNWQFALTCQHSFSISLGFARQRGAEDLAPLAVTSTVSSIRTPMFSSGM